jgi:hypothetical protein
MTPDDRRREAADILAAGLLRLLGPASRDLEKPLAACLERVPPSPLTVTAG